MIADEEDDIMEEIPVFLSRNMQDGLFVLQFPTKTRVGTFDKATVRNSFIKPINQEVKVEVDLDTMSANFDSGKAERLASASDGKGRTKSDRLPSHGPTMLGSQAYTSTRLMNDSSKYVVGIYADKEIHLTPISNILQMRPSFPHFDKEDKRTKAEQKKNNALDDGKEEEMQQVTVKFARASSSKQKSKERPDLANFLKQRKEEPWRATKWYTKDSQTAEIERQKLYANTHELSSAFAMDIDKYAKKLLPSHEKSNDIDSVLPPRVISKKHLKDMSLVEQLKALLKDVRMMTMNEILAFLQENFDSKITYDKVLRSLTQVATLLHGNWVPQSEVVYPKDAVSNLSGVSSELMARARDYVIYKFSRNPYLYRPEVITNTRLPPQEATEVLSSIARVNADKKWELLLPPDTKFEQKHPDLVSRQELIWLSTETQYNESEGNRSTKRVRKRSIREAKPLGTNAQLSQETTSSETNAKTDETATT